MNEYNNVQVSGLINVEGEKLIDCGLINVKGEKLIDL